MPVPLSIRPLARWFFASVLLLAPLAWAPPARAAKIPAPILNLPLEDLGYQPVPNRYFMLGDSVLTVHFVDDTHLLVTFTSRGLLTRLPDAEAADQDQNVTAALLELPTGKVLAKTLWRERDRGQYLWTLGHGRFILRTRTRLSLLDPLGNLVAGKPFEEEPFVELHRPIGYITVSPAHDLLSIETVPPPRPKAAAPSAQPATAPVSNGSGLQLKKRTEPAPAEQSGVQINFFRLRYEPTAGKPERLIVQSAGIVRAPSLIDIPATADGYLDVAQESAGVYLFDFRGHGGQHLELAPFETSCSPAPHFVSPTEFIAFGCRGSDDKVQMAGFNLHGEEPWINAFPSRRYFTSIVPAPVVGRFALSGTLLTGAYVDVDNLVPEQIVAQEIDVFQNWDGRTLLKLNASPFQRAGQNFDLSPNGEILAILHEGRVQTYSLPVPSKKDADALKLAVSYAPEHNDARITLGGKPTHRPGVAEEKIADESVGASPAAPTTAVPSQTAPETSARATAAAEAAGPVNGDADPGQRRVPPSLYSKEYPRKKGDPKPSSEPEPQ